MIGRKIAVLPAKRADQQRIAFHIKYINDACLRQSQLISRYFQDYTIPFIIVVVPQHSIPIILGVFRFCAVLLRIHVIILVVSFLIASEVNLCCTSPCILYFHRIRSQVYANVHSDNHSEEDNGHNPPCIRLYF